MIVPMKRISVVLVPQESEVVLEGLRDLGVLHLDQKQAKTPEQDEVLTRMRQVHEALAVLADVRVDHGASESSVVGPREATDRLLVLKYELARADQLIADWERRLAVWEAWGDFSPETIRQLSSDGIRVLPYVVPASEDHWQGWQGRFDLSSDRRFHRFVLVLLDGQSAPSDLEPLAWPVVRPQEKRRALAEARKARAQLTDRLTAAGVWRPVLTRELAELGQQLEWELARGSFQQEGRLSWVSGWIPVDQLSSVQTWASQVGVALILDDPSEDSSPPTKLKNSFFPNLMKPVFELLGIVPGYRERDISWPFFLFFSVFFGMILGDAAYGVLLTAVGLGFLVRTIFQGRSGKEVWILVTWLGFCTLAWGAVTGTWLATPFASLPGFLKALVLPLFDPSLVGSEAVSNNTTVFCFTLGFLQLGLASLWNCAQGLRQNFWKSLSHLGWFGMTLGLYQLVLIMVSKASLLPAFFPRPVLEALFSVSSQGTVSLPAWTLPLIGTSYLAILLLSFQDGKFWKGLATGAANFLPTTLNAISAFADNISYIRLFAVGLAGYYIEVSFASMASGVSDGTLVGAGIGALILVFGHSLNLVMGFLSVIVHGIRLNVLEFSNRLGMEWSGEAYQPFRLKSMPENVK